MDLITNFMNLVAPATALISLFLFVPPFYFFKLFLSYLASLFSEGITHKVVLITGASSGIGEQLAYQYAKKGAALALVARREASLREVADRAQDLGSPNVLVIRADVSKPDDCRRFVEETISHFGRYHLVNNAGIANICYFEEASDITNFTQVMDINFWGSVYPTYYALPHLKRTGGKILVNSSAAGWSPMPRMSFYNASKAALINFYETLRIEVGREVGVTIATTGWIESEMTKGKHLSKHGRMEVDQELRECKHACINAQVSLFPVVRTEECAKAMMDAAFRGDRTVTVPAWFRVLYLWRVFAPEVFDWCYRMLYVTRPGARHGETPCKKLMDMTGAKEFLYPSSIKSPEIKNE